MQDDAGGRHVLLRNIEKSHVAGASTPRPASRSSRAALPMLPLDPGAGRAEMVGLKHADVDLDVDVLLVLGQGLPRANRVLCAGDW
jgi:hypothetical protein